MKTTVRKSPFAPVVVGALQHRLSSVAVTEVSSVPAGVNQFADVILIKERLAKRLVVELDPTASAGPAHTHEPAEFPEGPIGPGTFRFGPGGAEDHEHTVTVTEVIEPGMTVELISSVSGPVPHQHPVTITARERVTIMLSRNDRLLTRIAKGVAEGPIDMAGIERIMKEHDDDPRTFAEQQMDRRLEFLDSAFDERAQALMWTTFEILMSDAENKEALILQAVDDYAAVMKNDVPLLMSGQLAKGLTEFLSAEDRPRFSDVSDRVAKLLPSGGEGGVMFENVSKEERTALDAIYAAAQSGGVSAELLVKALASGTASDIEIARLKKAITGVGDPVAEVHPLLKGKTEAEQAALQPVVDYFQIELSKSNDRSDKLEELIEKTAKAHRTSELTEIAKSFENIGTPVDDLLIQLQKADEHGYLDSLRGTLQKASDAQARAMTEIGETGDGSQVGFGKGGDGAKEADAQLVQKAVEIRKGREDTISKEQAYLEAIEADPDLAALAAGNAH